MLSNASSKSRAALQLAERGCKTSDRMQERESMDGKTDNLRYKGQTSGQRVDQTNGHSR